MGIYKRISQLLDEIHSHSRVADASFDLDACTVTLSFELHGERGFVTLIPRNRAKAGDIIRRKLRAAATSEMKGARPRNLIDARAATRKVHPNSIKILTNISELEVLEAEWDNISYGV